MISREYWSNLIETEWPGFANLAGATIGSVILTSQWRALSKAEPSRGYVALLGEVRLSSVRILLPFVRHALRIDRQLRHTPGVVGYRVAADVFGLAFYHLSAWIDAPALDSFVHTSPHRGTMEDLAERLGSTAFRRWMVNGNELPMHFDREWHRWQLR